MWNCGPTARESPISRSTYVTRGVYIGKNMCDIENHIREIRTFSKNLITFTSWWRSSLDCCFCCLRILQSDFDSLERPADCGSTTGIRFVRLLALRTELIDALYVCAVDIAVSVCELGDKVDEFARSSWTLKCSHQHFIFEFCRKCYKIILLQ